MWCNNCKFETVRKRCDLCGNLTELEVPVEVYWCQSCNIPVLKKMNDLDLIDCPLCQTQIHYLSKDIRPVFPEERLLLEVLLEKPLAFLNDSVWSEDNKYFVNGNQLTISNAIYQEKSANQIRVMLDQFQDTNNYIAFDKFIKKFIKANKIRLKELIDEAHEFIKHNSSNFPHENIVISFSGGKDSTVTADLTVRALTDPSLVHIFGNTTLEFPMTLEYMHRFRENNPKAIFKIAENKEQSFYKVCDDIGPPARMLRWCCSMFKTGPITRVLNRLYGNEKVLTFYGIRKCESVSRSRYNRVEDSSEAIKIQKQKVASPIFLWKDLDIWLYILTEGIDFNSAYRLGYDRVGCWCCPNNNDKAQFLSSIYMPVETEKWRDFLIKFATRLGKPDPEEYVKSGGWKARQGGNGLSASKDIQIQFTTCTSEENAVIYALNKPVNDNFLELFIPFGRIAPDLGRKLINETIVLDINSRVPILSIQPFSKDENGYTVKVKTLNVENPDELQRMVGYQVKKYNACRQCLKCESICRYRAISINQGEYHIDPDRCRQCRMCVTAKYLAGGCLMDKYLKTKVNGTAKR